MKRLLGSAALALAVLVMVSSVAMAWDFNDHVKIAPNQKGDVLIFPVYLAVNGGWETKFTVINTAQDRSVIAKVVFRSGIFTQELLDFIIYLTPTDVWTGIIRYNPTLNRVEVFSDDDSCFATAGTWASTATPFIAPLASLKCTADTANIGYVEVFEFAHTTATAMYPALGTSTALNLNQPPASKSALFNAYQNWATDSKAQGALVNDGINVLTGIEEFRNTSINQKAALTATVLRDYGTTRNPGNTTTLLNVSKETFFGDSIAYNKIGEVEAALAKNDLAMYYSNQNLTFHFFTFPTKYAYGAFSSDAPTCATATTFVGPYFTQKSTNGCIEYGAVNYDRSENSSIATTIVSPSTTAKMCQEVQWLGNFAFAEGWARYTLAPNSTAATTFEVMNALTTPYSTSSPDGSFTGAPVIGTVLNLNSTADGYVMVPAAYTDGLVRDTTAGATATITLPAVTGGVNYYYYQYQDEANKGVYDTNSTPKAFGYDINLPAGESESRLVRPDGHHPINP